VVVRPHFEWKEAYKGVAVQIFEEYTYVPGEGFCAIPPEYRVPEAYLQEKTIASKEEPYFVLYELETLKSCTLSIEKPLCKPTSLELQVLNIEQNPRVQTPEWLLEAVFKTEIGEVGLFPVWEALQEGRYYLFSPAGCLLLKQPRFNWLKAVTRRQWLKGGEVLRLTTLQWLRLSAFESVEIEDPLFVMQQMGGDHPLDLTGFVSSLRPYQETGVHWLWFLFRAGLSGLLCDEMGLGKTHQAMGLMAALNNQPQEGSCLQLVVCPTSVVYHWQALLERFLPGAKVVVFYGALRSLPELIHQRCILLTSYGTLRSDIELLSQVEFQLAVFDELQIAKNSRSQTHKALRKIRATMRLGLSGTPIENRLLELKALFDVVVPGYLPQESQFKELFVTPIERYQDKEKKGLLSRLVKPFILRRKKSEVLLELPEKIEEIAYCDLSEEQKELYQQSCKLHRDALIRDLESGDKAVPYLHVFALLSSLKQICDHPCLITKEYAHFQKHRSGKWDLFVELLAEIRDSGQKVVVFSQYLDMLDLMQVYLNEQGIGYTGVRGSTRDRKERIEKFQTDPECVVFLASLQAVGVGVDLTAASVVIHYDRWWNPARENQATDRVHRMGQNRGVQVFKMVTKGTLEEHIHNLIEKKKTLMEGVIGFDEQDQIKGLNREELLSLLQQIGQDGQ
jgi:SNF2 family DNA or RNA helicase